MKPPVWIGVGEILVLHESLHRQHGGAQGLRDRGLLESALARPLQLFSYDESADSVTLAAAYTAGIIQNHPFVDGNKRAGFLAGILFLEMNGFRFTASEEHATQAVRDLAAGRVGLHEYAAFLRANLKKPSR